MMPPDNLDAGLNLILAVSPHRSLKGAFTGPLGCQLKILKKKNYCLRGPTPFEDVIFYLWTDSNEICTTYVKLKINHILFVKNF